VDSDRAELSLSDVQELVAAVVPDRDALRWRGQGLTHGQLTDTSRQLANYFLEQGLGSVIDRDALAPWESGQDFVGILLYNRPEYIVSLFGALKARCVPYNINYRYGPEEIRQLLEASPTKALVYQPDFAEVLARCTSSLPSDAVLIEVGGSGDPLLPGAVSYEQILATSSTRSPSTSTSPDDLYVIFTGGTTGNPKAVMWRQADAWYSALSGPEVPSSSPSALREIVRESVRERPRIILPAPPLMHGGGQWATLTNVLRGNTVVMQSVVDRLDPGDIWSTIERERVYMMLITGNAYGIPLLDDLTKHHYDLGSLRLIITGAVAMTQDIKQGLMERLPGLRIIETIAASESGSHLSNVTDTDSSSDSEAPKTFVPSDDTVVLNDDRSGQLGHESGAEGWLARRGRVPLGYLGDPDRTRTVFPVLDGVRYSVPGDRVRLLATGEIQFLGRDSVTINSGGEKVFAEEVEHALLQSPEVSDALVTGRKHERWGQEIVAFVHLKEGAIISTSDLRARVAEQLARYKVPKVIDFVDEIPRSPAGKADYRWAKQRAETLP
jgi:3-oxocholest-4-en-26-oate---CoA ligase